MAVPLSGSGGSVIINFGVVDGPGGVWRGFPSNACMGMFHSREFGTQGYVRR